MPSRSEPGTSGPSAGAELPLLVFGGPYGNAQATAAVLAEAARRGLPPHRVLCTGDLVAYCGEPAATIATIRAADIRRIAGNCDVGLASGALDCGCGFAEDSACDRLSAVWFAAARRDVGAADRYWLATLPGRDVVAVGRRRLLVVHGGLETINQFVFATTPLEEKRRQLARAAVEGLDGIVGGHCGMPFTQVVDGRLWHNAGVAGMPANDGTPRVWYSVLTPRRGAVEIAHYALDYDHGAAQAAMARHGYPEAYRAALGSGLWPSCDVLPAFERSVQGRALTPATVVWRADGHRPGLGPHWPPWPVPATQGEAAETTAAGPCC